MAKLHFKYSTMNSGKTVDLLRTAYNYEENNYKVLVLKPSVDTKAANKIKTRMANLERIVDCLIDEEDSIIELLSNKLDDVKCIFIDESQFLTRNQVDELYTISKSLDIPVICYGLRLNFKMESFEGSRRLLEIADVLEELKTLCKCGQIARYVGRKVNGEYTVDGEVIVIDGAEGVMYVPLCGECYLSEVKNMDLPKIKNKIMRREYGRKDT